MLFGDRWRLVYASERVTKIETWLTLNRSNRVKMQQACTDWKSLVEVQESDASTATVVREWKYDRCCLGAQV